MKNEHMEEATKKGKDEIKAIKDDIKDIVKRMGNLKSDALDALSEDSSDLMSAMSDIKDRVVGKSNSNLKNMYSCIEDNPMKSALYFFGAGVILTMLMRK